MFFLLIYFYIKINMMHTLIRSNIILNILFIYL